MIEQQLQLQQQQPLVQQQQDPAGALQSSSSSCAVLQQVDWQPQQHDAAGAGSLTVEQLLCCHVHAPNGE
jgi:hypothetical protein